MSPPVLLVWFDKVNYMYGSIERLFHASSSIVSLINYMCGSIELCLHVWLNSIERLFHASSSIVSLT